MAGAEEHPRTVATAAADSRWLQGAHAEVFYRAYEGVHEHSFPRDFETALPHWISFILGTGPKPIGGESE